MIIELSRQERLEIYNCINEHLQKMAAQYAASCDAKRPNAVLFHSHGQLMRLRDKVLTGKDYAEQDADAQEAAEASERGMDKLPRNVNYDCDPIADQRMDASDFGR